MLVVSKYVVSYYVVIGYYSNCNEIWKKLVFGN